MNLWSKQIEKKKIMEYFLILDQIIENLFKKSLFNEEKQTSRK